MRSGTMRAFRIRPMPRLLGYPLLGAMDGCLIVIGLGGVVGWYNVAFYPLPLLAAAVGVAAAREWSRPLQHAFVGDCLGIPLAFVALIPFATNPGMVLPAMTLGLAAGGGLSQGIKR